MTESITYLQYRKIIREEARNALQILLEDDERALDMADSDYTSTYDDGAKKLCIVYAPKTTDEKTKPPVYDSKINPPWKLLSGFIAPISDVNQVVKTKEKLKKKFDDEYKSKESNASSIEANKFRTVLIR